MIKNNTFSKLLSKLQVKLDEKDFYEAHQLYKIIYFRYITQQKYEEAMHLIIDGSNLLLNKQQIPSGYDLAMLYLEGIKKEYLPFDKISIDKLVTIFKLLPKESLERNQFQCTLLDILKQSTSNDTQSLLNLIHSQFGKVLWAEKDFPQARYHFIRSSDYESCASMLIDYAVNYGYPNETDLFIAQTVFQYLCLKNQNTAQIVFFSYVKMHPVIHKDNPPFPLPLLNFLCFLLFAIQNKDKLTVFSILCDKYERALKRDPSFFTYLEKIGQLFFGLKPRNSSQNSFGMFDNIFQNLMTNFQGMVAPQNPNIPDNLADEDEMD
ncbi:Golgi to ER traffic protein 4 homolog [Gordionus sp. m RMFG-2023]|uniref:Golgi to ER traffic protein 4 homolog n=1 Tax=Gordionus sp. m RMFG-2023 TaxID=3053472 RepID=UPI0031FD6D4F